MPADTLLFEAARRTDGNINHCGDLVRRRRCRCRCLHATKEGDKLCFVMTCCTAVAWQTVCLDCFSMFTNRVVHYLDASWRLLVDDNNQSR